MERCFLCHRKMDKKTGLCTNKKCIRSKPLEEKEKPEKTTDVPSSEIGGWVESVAFVLRL
ncbi:hypothetical protein [Dialister invisus]|uniref:hypothetical protein n=1 Tax=Dialister invisus TaxID=218538 RepID=UPI0026580ADD|nr:hypothetical protein [Dialister invisus]